MLEGAIKQRSYWRAAVAVCYAKNELQLEIEKSIDKLLNPAVELHEFMHNISTKTYSSLRQN